MQFKIGDEVVIRRKRDPFLNGKLGTIVYIYENYDAPYSVNFLDNNNLLVWGGYFFQNELTLYQSNSVKLSKTRDSKLLKWLKKK
jgi:hypothetical protein